MVHRPKRHSSRFCWCYPNPQCLRARGVQCYVIPVEGLDRIVGVVAMGNHGGTQCGVQQSGVQAECAQVFVVILWQCDFCEDIVTTTPQSLAGSVSGDGNSACWWPCFEGG